MRVGTASQPASVVAESEAASGELHFMMHEAAKLRKENAKLKRNMEKLAPTALAASTRCRRRRRK